MTRCGPNKITLLVGAPKMAGHLVASSSAAASDMAVGSVYIYIYRYWGRALEQHVLPHGRAPTAPDGANFQTEKWTVFQVQRLHPSKYIYIYTSPTRGAQECTGCGQIRMSSLIRILIHECSSCHKNDHVFAMVTRSEPIASHMFFQQSAEEEPGRAACTAQGLT